MNTPRCCLLIASISGLAGFMVALFAGMLAGNILESVLEHSILALLGCFIGGLVVGRLLDGVLDRHAQELRIAEESEATAAESSPDSDGVEADDEPSELSSAA
ncbi:MAG: hypothetical protein VX641_03350 [Planctomycetota bacterium]|nr:hypothetical protein [Planctomycetota bacterium]